MKVPKPLLMTKLMSSACAWRRNRTPAEAGLAYEDVEFTSSDHLDIKGWFVPAAAADGAERGPVVLFVHGWMWNRMGNVAGRVPFNDADVDFLPAVKALHDAGFHVLLFDLGNHGESGSRPPITFGQWEARDMLGAVAYLRTRDDVDGERIGVIGTSMGGNTALWARAVLPAHQGDPRRPAHPRRRLHGPVRRRPARQARHHHGQADRLDVRRHARPPPQQGRPRRPRPPPDRHHGQVRPRAPATPGAPCRTSRTWSTPPPAPSPW